MRELWDLLVWRLPMCGSLLWVSRGGCILRTRSAADSGGAIDPHRYPEILSVHVPHSEREDIRPTRGEGHSSQSSLVQRRIRSSDF